MATSTSSTLTAPAHWAAQWLRIGWFLALNRTLEWQAGGLGPAPSYKPQRPVPKFNELLADLAGLVAADADAVKSGLYPPMPDDGTSLTDYIARIRAMMADLPEAHRRLRPFYPYTDQLAAERVGARGSNRFRNEKMHKIM